MVRCVYRVSGRATLGCRLVRLPQVRLLSDPCLASLTVHFHSLISTNATFREIVISLAATYGLYFTSSFLHFEPWHMFTCFLQYLFLLPSCE